MPVKPKRKPYVLRCGTIVFMFTFLLILFLSRSVASKNIELLSSTDSELVFRYIPQLLALSTITGDEQEFCVPEVIHCAHLTKVGKPMLPCRRFLIGLPVGATVEVNLLNINVQNILLPAAIAPFPKVTNSNTNFSRQCEVYDLDMSVYSSDAMWPPEWSTVSAVKNLRYQSVVELIVYPFRYNPKTGEAMFCKNITMQVKFVGDGLSKEGKGLARKSAFNNIYRHTLLNHKTAPKWRQLNLHKQSHPISTDSGLLFRMTLQEEGIYLLEGKRLRELGISTEGVNPARFQIYYGGGRELQPYLSAETPPLEQVATKFLDGNLNGKFDSDDALLFYGQAISGWEENESGRHHYINHYTNDNAYWLHVGQGARKEMRVRKVDIDSNFTPQIVDRFPARQFGEEEKLLPESSGIDWMSGVLKGTTIHKYPIQLNHVCPDEAGTLYLRLKGLSETYHPVDIYLNDRFLKNIEISYTLAKTVTLDLPDVLHNGNNTLMLKLNGSESSIGFDWYEVEFWQFLRAVDFLTFSSSGREGILKYEIDGFDSNDVMVFDITDPFSVRQMGGVEFDSLAISLTFTDSVRQDDARYYMVLNRQQFQQPTSIVAVQADRISNLLSKGNEADYVIITHESLFGPALDRLCEHRSNPLYWPHQGIPQVMVVTTQEVYDQFSHGLIDPVAIRNFLKYAFENWQKAPTYILLVGSATYDFKDNLGLGKSLLVPSYENRDMVSDDWYVNLTNDRFMDMIIGRLPINSQEELNTVVDKIIRYDSQPASGPWRSRITLVADDIYRKTDYSPSDFIFIRDSEILAESDITQHFDISKIYLEKYAWDRSFNKPSAKKALLNSINNGALYLNFLGHANWNMLAHENVFSAPADLSFLNNFDHLPIFFAGTCETARIDDPYYTSMAELLLLHPEGGVIASIGSARWTIHQASFNVNRTFYETIFSHSQEGSMTIGQILLLAKTLGGFPDQTEIMFLLGDPALRMPLPRFGIDLTVNPDTLSLQRRILVHGTVRDSANTVNNFSGYCGLRLYDSTVSIEKPIYGYQWPGKIIFEGMVPVENGEFEANFFASADTIAGGAVGRVVACAWKENKDEMHNPSHAVGAMDSLVIKPDSLTVQTQRDTLPPELKISIEKLEIENDATEIHLTAPFLITGEIYDAGNGFNPDLRTELGIQFKLDGLIDDKFYQSGSVIFDDNTLQKGHFYYEVKDVPLGEHHISVDVFDKALNSTRWRADIVIVPGHFTVGNVLNHPNPAYDHTYFTFDLTRDAVIKLKIYTVSGRCIRTIEGVGRAGFNTFPEEGWDCTDQEGDVIANGVYLYKVVADIIDSPLVYVSGRTHAEVIGKLFIMR